MKRHIFLLTMLLTLAGCQSAYRVSPESMPRALSETITLTDIEGATHNFSNIYQGQLGTLVFFWQASCPCVKRYQGRINELHEKFSLQGVSMAYVSSNSNEDFAHVQEEYARRGCTLPLFRDEGGRLANAIGARGTPVAALFNQAGELIFLGWIDNERYPGEKGREAYLEDALNDLVAKRPIAVNTSPMFGCAIR